MDADAAVQPHQNQHQALARRAIRPEHVQDIGVAVVDAEQLVRAAGADDVRHQPERDQEAKRDLRDLPRRHLEAAPAVELVQCQQDVDRERRIQQQRRRRAAPHREEHRAPPLPWRQANGCRAHD
jgi:hypothetical protein